ncbi:MAG: hypothetical protein U1A27_08520 [Phycisphaerae bacterium]
MSSAAPAPPDNTNWETELAPRVSTLKLALPLLVFAAWIALLAWMTVRRWYGALL